MTESFPLSWPAGFPRTKNPTRSKFVGATFDSERRAVLYEIKRLGGSSVVISTNLPLKLDGTPYASARQPEDKGVAIYFMYKGGQVVLACDKWNQMADNMRAIQKSIEAMRGLERWGASDILNRAFAGFKALGEGSPIVIQETCWTILGVSPDSDMEEIKFAYREKAKEVHPDITGGPDTEFIKLKTAYEEAATQKTNGN